MGEKKLSAFEKRDTQQIETEKRERERETSSNIVLEVLKGLI